MMGAESKNALELGARDFGIIAICGKFNARKATPPNEPGLIGLNARLSENRTNG
jgi:hypothetical protein